jgi:hypothetical protein
MADFESDKNVFPHAKLARSSEGVLEVVRCIERIVLARYKCIGSGS